MVKARVSETIVIFSPWKLYRPTNYWIFYLLAWIYKWRRISCLCGMSTRHIVTPQSVLAHMYSIFYIIKNAGVWKSQFRTGSSSSSSSSSSSISIIIIITAAAATAAVVAAVATAIVIIVFCRCYSFKLCMSVIVRASELEGCFFANNSVIFASATMKLDQNLVRLTP